MCERVDMQEKLRSYDPCSIVFIINKISCAEEAFFLRGLVYGITGTTVVMTISVFYQVIYAAEIYSSVYFSEQMIFRYQLIHRNDLPPHSGERTLSTV